MRDGARWLMPCYGRADEHIGIAEAQRPEIVDFLVNGH